MKYSDTTNLTGIIQEVERLTGLGYTGVSGNATTLKEVTSLANIEMNKVWHNIFMSTGNWKYDDNNETNLPIATTDLVSGTKTYAVPAEALTIQRIEMKDEAGNWTRLEPISLEQIYNEGEFLDTASTPRYYTLLNNTFELYPEPNYSSSDGIKVFYDREAVEFATTDTTKTPGFASPYHSIIPMGVALSWLKVKLPNSNQIPLLERDYAKLELNLKQFYGQRFKDKKPRISRVYKSFK